MMIIYYVSFGALGLLFGSMLFATVLGFILSNRRVPGAGRASALLAIADAILIVAFFVWPLRLSTALLMYATIAIVFFGAMYVAVITLAMVFRSGRSSMIRAQEAPKAAV